MKGKPGEYSSIQERMCFKEERTSWVKYWEDKKHWGLEMMTGFNLMEALVTLARGQTEVKQWQILLSWAPKSLQMVTAAMELKDAPWKKSYDKPGQCIKMQRHHFANKALSSQSHGFSSSHVQIWELDHKEGWAPKNWCFWTVVLEKTLESPLDYKIKPVNPKGNQPRIRRTDAEAQAPILWPPDAKSRLIGKDADAGKD